MRAASKPVDPLLVEAREIAAAHMPHPYDARQITEGNRDNWHIVQCTLAALRRGMELAPRKELTREMLREAVSQEIKAIVTYDLTRLHAALTEALQ